MKGTYFLLRMSFKVECSFDRLYCRKTLKCLLIHYSINCSVFYMRIFNMYLELGEILFRTRLNIVVISKCDILSNLNSDRADGL